MTESSDALGSVDEFFVESTEQSRIKTSICTGYFFAWERIITPRSRSGRVGYVGVYVGPGRLRGLSLRNLPLGPCGTCPRVRASAGNTLR